MTAFSKIGRFELVYPFLNLHPNNPTVPLIKMSHLAQILGINNYTNIVN